jgi:hypothetical protein
MSRRIGGVVQGIRAAESMRTGANSTSSVSRSQEISSSSSPDQVQHKDFNPKTTRVRPSFENVALASVALGRAAQPLPAKQSTSISSNIAPTSESSSQANVSSQANDDRFNSLPAPRTDSKDPALAASASASVSASVSAAPVKTNQKASSASIQSNVKDPPGPPTMTPELLNQEEKKMMKLRDEVLSKTGRQNGPDIALKVIFNMKDEDGTEYLKTIINENSSITEVMNVFAFLVNKTHDINSIVKEFSFFKYEHDAVGDYITTTEIDENDANYEQHVLSVFKVLENVNVPLFNIDSFQPYTGDGKNDFIILPAGIIKRDAESYHTAPIEVKIVHIPKLFTLCILQMINILEKTRGVFGGWTKLFKEMQGGGIKSKSTTKKTRRSNNCRRN